MEPGEIFLLIAMPCYGNTMMTRSVSSLFQLTHGLRTMGIKHEPMWIGNESLIPRARNRYANRFLDGHPEIGPYTHILYLDVDIGFDWEDVVRMLQADKDIISLPYTRKQINWDRVVDAVKAGVEAKDLPEIIGSPVMDDLGRRTHITQEFAPMSYLGTGTMLIKREVFAGLKAAHPEWEYKLMNDERHDNPNRDTAWDFFQTGKSPVTGFYLSEDYFFCQEAEKLGYSIGCLPAARTTHTGSFEYVMNIPMIAKSGLSL